MVTGGSAGLGRALAKTFGRHSARVVIAARREGPLNETVESIESRGGACQGILADVTCDEDVQRLIRTVIEEYGRLDVLVNAAGRSARGAIAETTVNDFQELLDLNFLATVRCTRAALPHLQKTSGHVVNIGSLASKVGVRYLGAYPASKFAVAAYSQQLRLELATQGVHVLLVCPGPIARSDGGGRYQPKADGLPDKAAKPGGGARVRALDADWLAKRIVTACERRDRELVVPGKARLLFALSQLSPRLGDWLLKKWT